MEESRNSDFRSTDRRQPPKGSRRPDNRNVQYLTVKQQMALAKGVEYTMKRLENQANLEPAPTPKNGRYGRLEAAIAPPVAPPPDYKDPRTAALASDLAGAAVSDDFAGFLETATAMLISDAEECKYDPRAMLALLMAGLEKQTAVVLAGDMQTIREHAVYAGLHAFALGIFIEAWATDEEKGRQWVNLTQ